MSVHRNVTLKSVLPGDIELYCTGAMLCVSRETDNEGNIKVIWLRSNEGLELESLSGRATLVGSHFSVFRYP